MESDNKNIANKQNKQTNNKHKVIVKQISKRKAKQDEHANNINKIMHTKTNN